MFPNPQDALPHPLNPNLEQYRKLAKDLVKVCRTQSLIASATGASGFVQNLVQLSKLEISPNLRVEVSRWVDQVTEFAAKTLMRLLRSAGAVSPKVFDFRDDHPSQRLRSDCDGIRWRSRDPLEPLLREWHRKAH